MANTIPAALVDQVVSDGILQAFTDYNPILNTFTTDFSDGTEKEIRIPLFAADAATTFNGDYTASSDTTVTSVDLSINTHKFSTVHLTDIESLNSSRVRLSDLGYQAAEAVITAMIADSLALVTAANYGAAVFDDTAANFNRADVVAVKAACDLAKMPTGRRSLILNTAYYNALLGDDVVISANSYGQSNGIQAGMIENLFGFRVMGSTNVPDNDEHLCGIACVPQAIALGVRYVAPQAPEEYLEARPVTDPNTGLTFGLRRWYDTGAGRHYLTVEANYGTKVGIAAGLKRLTDGTT